MTLVPVQPIAHTPSIGSRAAKAGFSHKITQAPSPVQLGAAAVFAGAAVAVTLARPRRRPSGTRSVVHGGQSAKKCSATVSNTSSVNQSEGPVAQTCGAPADAAKPTSVVELEARLQVAVEKEDYIEAARLRDEIIERSLDGEAAVLAANERFFDACRGRDLEGMAELWHTGKHTCCIHSASRPVYGHDAIMESWSSVFRDKKRKEGKRTEQSVIVRDNIGRAVCCQTFKNGAVMVVTNHFEHTMQGWKLCCHQAGVIEEPKRRKTMVAMVRSVTDWIGRRWRKNKTGKLEAAREKLEVATRQRQSVLP